MHSAYYLHHRSILLSSYLEYRARTNDEKSMSTTIPNLEEMDMVPGTFLLIRGKPLLDTKQILYQILTSGVFLALR